MNENTYTSQQAQKLKSQPDLFSVSEIGETLVVSSLRHQLWVEWHNDGTVEIGVGQDFTALLNTFTFPIVRDFSFLLKTFTISFAKSSPSPRKCLLSPLENFHFLSCQSPWAIV